MTYYDSQENVEEYIDMAEGYDGRELIEVLRKYLATGSTVLELGMGPGKDLALLNEYYRVTGSDRSQLFLDRCRQAHPDADLLHLDAITVDTERRFDAIYSNKVLHHLTKSELQQSFQAQARVLNPQGIALHSFWYGAIVEEYVGLLFVYHAEASIQEAIGERFEILEIRRYAEMEPDDSLYVVLGLGSVAVNLTEARLCNS